MNSNEALITGFYTAFTNKDYQGMQSCYADNIVFSDNAFPNLHGNQAKAMWHMLAKGSKDLVVTFTNVKAGETSGSADWTAVYTLSLTGNKVTNHVHAEFEISNGKIIRHTDTFNFYKWARQAFGLKGKLLGWMPFFKHKVQAVTHQRLIDFIDKNPLYKS